MARYVGSLSAQMLWTGTGCGVVACGVHGSTMRAASRSTVPYSRVRTMDTADARDVAR